jgi:glutaredoxin
MKVFFIVAGMLLALNAAQATEMYRWVDKNGVMHYGDKSREDAEKIRLGGYDAASGVDDASLPYATRVARKNFPVTLYVAERCADICNQARDYLKKRRVPFAEVMLKTEEEFAAFKQKSGTENVPTISVGRNWLKGFQSEDWRNELDAAGYPK